MAESLGRPLFRCPAFSPPPSASLRLPLPAPCSSLLHPRALPSSARLPTSCHPLPPSARFPAETVLDHSLSLPFSAPSSPLPSPLPYSPLPYSPPSAASSRSNVLCFVPSNSFPLRFPREHAPSRTLSRLSPTFPARTCAVSYLGAAFPVVSRGRYILLRLWVALGRSREREKVLNEYSYYPWVGPGSAKRF